MWRRWGPPANAPNRSAPSADHETCAASEECAPGFARDRRLGDRARSSATRTGREAGGGSAATAREAACLRCVPRLQAPQPTAAPPPVAAHPEQASALPPQDHGGHAERNCAAGSLRGRAAPRDDGADPALDLIQIVETVPLGFVACSHNRGQKIATLLLNVPQKVHPGLDYIRQVSEATFRDGFGREAFLVRIKGHDHHEGDDKLACCSREGRDRLRRRLKALKCRAGAAIIGDLFRDRPPPDIGLCGRDR